MPTSDSAKPVVVITGAAGNIGTALCGALRDSYVLVAFDRHEAKGADATYTFDLTSESSVRDAVARLKADHGGRVAAVVHLAAFFDFTGEENPLYEKVNVEGTRNLLKALEDIEVERFIYSSTMLVHEPTAPGRRISEQSPLGPAWAYPISKLKTEEVIHRESGDMPYTILRLAGLYDEETAVPTLAHQITRIYERDLQSHLYPGNRAAGQAMLHRDDMIDAFRRVIDRRNDMPKEDVILIGESHAPSYEALQNRLGELIHGRKAWDTMSIPAPAAKAGSWVLEKAEPLVPDQFDHGEKPFIRPFMVDMASDHYELDIRKARDVLGWQPQHALMDDLPCLVTALKKDPVAWYEANHITPPDWAEVAEDRGLDDADDLKERYDRRYVAAHLDTIWAHFMNLGLACWLLTAPAIMGYQSTGMWWSDIASGALLFVFAALSLSHRMRWARWVCCVIGLWLLTAPLIFLAPTAAAYLNGTLVGILVIGFSVLVRPAPGLAPMAVMTGPVIPKGWNYSPSGWFQRLPIIILALLGFLISRYLCAYQLGHIDGVWEPFFVGALPDARNGTEEIITSSVSRAWPVPDAGLGALTYALEILTGILGSARRWRTMPWLVLLFGILIVPLGIVSITFIIIQPVVLGTWCSLCLLAAAAMLIQIPYSVDEIVATCQFLRRRMRAGRPLLRIFFTGDTDDGPTAKTEERFNRPAGAIARDMLGGGISVPWTLALAAIIGIWLMFTRLTLGAAGTQADLDHVIGSLAITVAVSATAEVARAFRFLLVPLGAVLLIGGFFTGAGTGPLVSSVVCGLALIGLSLPRGRIHQSYGSWDRFIR